MWLKSNWEWEVTFLAFFGFTRFVIFSTIRKSNRLNIFGCSTKLEGKSFGCSCSSWPNVIRETVCKKVPISMTIWSSIITIMILSVDRVHRHKVARVLPISKEFESKSWNESLTSAWSNSRWHSDEPLISTLKDSWVCTSLISFKRNFPNNSNWMYVFSSLSKKTTWHQIAIRIKCWVHRLQKETWHLQSTWIITPSCISYNLAPQVISLVCSTQW